MNLLMNLFRWWMRVAVVSFGVPVLADPALNAEQVIEAALSAHGGREAIARLTLVVETGQLGQTGNQTYKYWWTPEAQRLDWRSKEGEDTVVRREDRAHWSKSIFGVITHQFPVARHDHLDHPFVYLLTHLARRPLELPVSSLSLRPPFHVLTITHEGEAPWRVWMHATTGTIERLEEERGDRAVETKFGDWRVVEGVRVPFRQERERRVHQTISLSLAGALSPSWFLRPPATPAPTASLLPVTLTMVADEEDHWLVPVRLDRPDRRGWLMVDTGANMTNLAEEILPPDVERMAIAGSTSTVTGQKSRLSTLVKVSALHLGPLTLTGWWASAHEGTRFMPISSKRHVVGLLGGDFFQQFLVQLNPARGEMVVWPKDALPPRDLTWLPLTFMRDVPHLDVQVNGQPARLGLDTGAAANKLRARYAFPGGWAGASDRPVKSTVAAGLDGSREQATMFIGRTMTAGPVTWHQPLMHVAPWDGTAGDGLLGFAAFKPFVTWWDYAHGRLGIAAASSAAPTLSAYWYDYQEYVEAAQRGRPDELIPVCESLAKRHPERIDVLVDHHLDALTALKRNDEIPKVIRATIRERGERPALYVMLATYYVNQRQPDEGLEALNRALVLGYPDDGLLVLQILWKAHEMKQEFDRALPIAERAYAWYPWEPVTLQGVAGLLKTLKQYDRAIPFFQKMVVPQYPITTVQLAGVCALAGRQDEALGLLSRLKRAIRTAEGREWWATLPERPDLAPLKSDPRFAELFP